MRDLAIGSLGLALILGGCGPNALALPDDPIEKAATCGVIAAASERAAAGIKGDLSADAQGRILHYALLAGSSGQGVDMAKVNAVSKAQLTLSDTITSGKWETLKPACAAAFPETKIATPTLPAKQKDAVWQCDALTGFVRKALGNAESGMSDALTDYGVLADKLSSKAAALGKPDKGETDKALAAAARLGPPPAVIAACKAKFG